MKIIIGIFAYNEAAVIAETLSSLLGQSLFREPESNLNIEIIVVPNGCSDDTASVAEKTLNDLKINSTTNNFNYKVCELKQPGKTNAWNVFVHNLSDPKADYIFLMDADIQLIEQQTLRSMIDVLQTTPEAHVSVDRPIKDVLLKENKNIIELLSALISKLSGSKTIKENSAAWICGQLYCVRAEILRRIWLPVGILNEDGFLYTAITTDLWQSPVKPERVILASQAAHTFEAYTNFYNLWRHEKGLICGNVINQLIYEDLLTATNDYGNMGQIVKNKNEQNQRWLQDLIQAKTAEKGWWLIPRLILIRRFLSLKNKPIHKSILLFPLALTAFLIDLLIAIQANWELHEGKGLIYWGK